jgi:hypothetical protein
VCEREIDACCAKNDLNIEAGTMYLKSSRTPFKREVARLLALLTMP